MFAPLNTENPKIEPGEPIREPWWCTEIVPGVQHAIVDLSFRTVASPDFAAAARAQRAVRSNATDPFDDVVLGRNAERQAALPVIVAEVLQALCG